MSTPLNSNQRYNLHSIFNSAINAVSPENAVTSHLKLRGSNLICGEQSYDLEKIEHIYVLGAGKGAAPMVVALENLLGSQINDGLVCVKYDHNLPTTTVKIAEASHPVPDQNGIEATRKMIDIAEKAGPNDLVLCVITGGASALTPAFVEGISLQDVQELTTALLGSGATIHEINTVRKHLSTFSGGQLAVAASPAQVLSLIISDVIGDDLSIIASGPTSPDPSTFKDAISILHKYDVTAPPSINNHLEKGYHGAVSETPKPGDSVFSKVLNQLIATNADAVAAAQSQAEHLGYTVEIAPTMEGEARDVAKNLLNKSRNIGVGTCIIAGGETTVTLTGDGLGGRNQEMALAAGLEIKEDENLHCLFAGTDGTDGPTDATGGFSCPRTMKSMIQQDICGTDFLSNNDAYHFLEKTDSLLKTGPTRTNVMDIAILIHDKQS